MKKIQQKLLITALSLTAFMGALAFNQQQTTTVQQQPAEIMNAVVFDVGVIRTSRQFHQARVVSHGEVQPRFHLTLMSEVGGRIT